MGNPTKLVLLYGGKSGEHEISLKSAASVLHHLNASMYEIIPIGMDKEGCFYLNSYQDLLNYPECLPVETAHSKRLPSLIANGRLAVDGDVIFPVVHGPLYEDGCLQGILELTDVAYVGCGVLSSSIGMDKDMTRRLVCHDQIKSARYRVLSWHMSAQERLKACEKAAEALNWPLFVKPCCLGSSVGIHKVKNIIELQAAVNDALRYDAEVLIEEFIKGREIELAVLENDNPCESPLVSTVGEITINHTDGFYSYNAKYIESDQTELHVPANLDKDIITQLQKMAAEIFVGLKCRGMARVDFFVDDKIGAIYFNEINTLPGFTSISMYPKLWQASGLSYPLLLDRLIHLAMVHHRCKQQLVTNYQ